MCLCGWEFVHTHTHSVCIPKYFEYFINSDAVSGSSVFVSLSFCVSDECIVNIISHWSAKQHNEIQLQNKQVLKSEINLTLRLCGRLASVECICNHNHLCHSLSLSIYLPVFDFVSIATLCVVSLFFVSFHFLSTTQQTIVEYKILISCKSGRQSD